MTLSHLKPLTDQGLVQAVIESPRGSTAKYKYDEAAGIFRMHKRLPLGFHFPYDFGFIPGTRGEDGDPLDVLVMHDTPSFTGCVVTLTLIGVLEASQGLKGEKAVRNDRFLGVAANDRIAPAPHAMNDPDARVWEQIEYFFVSYNRYEGKIFQPLGRGDAAQAMALVRKGIIA